MVFDEISGPAVEGATIECSLESQQKQFSITDVDETESGVLLTLIAQDGTQWTLTQRAPSTYDLEAPAQQANSLTSSDITIQ